MQLAWTLPQGPVHSTPEEVENGRTTLKHNTFPVHSTMGNLKLQESSVILICIWGKLGQGNHVIIVTSSLTKGSVFKMNSVHTKTKIRRFQIPPVWKAFSSDKLRFRDGLVWTVALTVEIKLRFKFLQFEEHFQVKITVVVTDLVWMESLTEETKLRFQISPALCGRCPA